MLHGTVIAKSWAPNYFDGPLARGIGPCADRAAHGRLDDEAELARCEKKGLRIHDLLGHPDARLGDLALHQGAHGDARADGGRISLRATDERRASRSTVVDDVHAYRVSSFYL